MSSYSYHGFDYVTAMTSQECCSLLRELITKLAAAAVSGFLLSSNYEINYIQWWLSYRQGVLRRTINC